MAKNKSRKNRAANAFLDSKKAEELHAMASELQLMASSTDATTLRERMGALQSGGYDNADTLHNIFLDFGYPEELGFSNFWNMYRRFGVAKNVIELPVDVGWLSPPTIESGNTQFIRDFEKLNKRVSVWSRLKGLDTRQRVGRYAGMFMRVRDGLRPDQPLDKQLNGEATLMEMMPLYESQLKITESNQDASSEDFGQPIMLQWDQSAEGSRNEDANNTINIHASRIVFAAEGSDNGWIQGIPALEAIYNSLMDLRKIIGGGGEGFYKNSSQNVVFDLKDAANATTYADKLNDFNAQYDDFTRNRSRRAMWTPGMEAKTLDSTLISPKEFFDVALNDIAAGSQIPATILIGQQTGRLASSEDSRQFLSVVQARRENFMTDMTRDVLDWCIEFGVLPAAEYEVEWDDLLARSDVEKLESAERMAAINEKQFRAAGGAPFTGEEIREAGGFEPEELEPPGDEDLPEDEA